MNYIQMAIQKKKKTELKHTSVSQQGFSFLELMVVLALLGLLGAFVVPNLFRSQKNAERKELLYSFETLIKDTVVRSIVEGTTHQIYIDIAHEVIQMRMYNPASPESNPHKKFIPVQDGHYLTEIKFLKKFKINNFFINGVDEVTSGTAMQDVMFYIMPDGTSQAIIINFIAQDEDSNAQDIHFSCLINPFYARMFVHETFQTP